MLSSESYVGISMASEDGVRNLGPEYRGVLVREIRMHRTYSVVAVVTGLGLVGLGIVISPSYSDLGWLLLLVGILRAVSAAYDIGRKDQLQKSLERIDERARAKPGTS
jgi:hypothetical protein